MSEVTVKVGQKLTSRVSYSARAFLLAAGEVPAGDFAAFDQSAHQPRLLPVAAGQSFAALTNGSAGRVYAKLESDGKSYAAALLPGSFDVA